MGKKQDRSGSQTNTNEPAQDNSTKPEFIYGGPFIKTEKENLILDMATPMNVPLQGIFKQSCAYSTLKERLPIILTKVIDYLSREGSKIKSAHGASDSDVTGLIQYITKLKNDLITNKQYDLLTVDTPEAKRWNTWIINSQFQYYFTNAFLFTECYVYRRLREGCELSKGLKNFDPFDDQKDKSFTQSLERMCVVAEKLVTMLPPSEKEKRKADFIMLLKICLWANKCDLSLTNGEQVAMKGMEDPFDVVTKLKDMVLVDDSGKYCDQMMTKAEALAKTIEGAPETPPANSKDEKPEEAEAPPPEEVPCPAKMTIPPTLIFDIICDNAGYELFTDLCLAHFLVEQGIVKKVRFHVKQFGWFVSDVTPRDFKRLISSCISASYSVQVPLPPQPDAAVEEPQNRTITAAALQELGQAWNKYMEDGTFVMLSEDFWTSPHVFRDMKKYDPALYRSLQMGVSLLVKGDLNYRKLVGDKNWNPTTTFETALEGFMPAPLIALRTVKAEVICGLPGGRADALAALDPHWKLNGDYGLIQYCPKSEGLKVSELPCEAYGEECRGVTCPRL